MPSRKLTPKAEAALETTSADRLAELVQDPKLTKVVAANPAAPPDLLEQLSHSADKAVRKALVSNPSTPPSVLVALGSQFPEQLLENPVFDLLLLENPNLLAELPKSTLNSLLKRDSVPVELIHWAVHKGDVTTLQSLLINPQVPADVIAELQKHHSKAVREAASLHVNSENTIALVVDKALKCRPALQKEDARLNYPLLAGLLPLDSIRFLTDSQRADLLSYRSHCSVEILRYSFQYEDDRIRREILQNPRCPVEFLRKMASQKEGWVADHPSCPIDVLQDLSLHQNDHIRWRVALNPSCPEDLRIRIIRDLIDSEDEHIRRSLALRAIKLSCPHELQQELLLLLQEIKDKVLDPEESMYIRADVVANLNCPAEWLSIVAEFEDEWETRSAVALNPNCPIETLQKLACDTDWDVQAAVASNPNCSEEMVGQVLLELSRHRDERARCNAASASNCPVDLLRALAGDNNYLVRQSVGHNPNCPVDLLRILAADKDDFVRRSVGRNPSCPVDLLKVLSSDKNEYVRESVGCNPSCPVDILLVLAGDRKDEVREAVGRHPSCSEDLLRYLAVKSLEALTSGSTPSLPRLLAFRSPDCPSAALAKNVRSRDWLERAVIAANPSTPNSALKQLANDGNRLVRQAAGNSLKERQIY